MRVLIDTNVLLWSLDDTQRLSNRAKSMLADPAHRFIVSSVSIAEIHIKTAIGKLTVAADVEAEIDNLGFDWMVFTNAHARWLSELPLHHRDPFDRMLIGQAIEEGLSILTSDDKFERYPVHVIRN